MIFALYMFVGFILALLLLVAPLVVMVKISTLWGVIGLLVGCALYSSIARPIAKFFVDWEFGLKKGTK